jgi:predicted transcriptional regulator
MPAPHRKQLFEVEADADLAELSQGKIQKAIQEQAEQPVSEVMQPIVGTVDFTDHLTKVVYKMIGQDQTLLPVMREDRIVGVVRSVDVFHEIAKMLI